LVFPKVPVEAITEFIEVGLQMFWSDTMFDEFVKSKKTGKCHAELGSGQPGNGCLPRGKALSA
jgi:hypothetical protein